MTPPEALLQSPWIEVSGVNPPTPPRGARGARGVRPLLPTAMVPTNPWRHEPQSQSAGQEPSPAASAADMGAGDTDDNYMTNSQMDDTTLVIGQVLVHLDFSVKAQTDSSVTLEIRARPDPPADDFSQLFLRITCNPPGVDVVARSD